MAISSRSGEPSLAVRALLWLYYTGLLLVVTAALPCIVIHSLLFDDDSVTPAKISPRLSDTE